MAVLILVIDDYGAARKTLSNAIYTKIDCEVHEAADPAEARSLLELYSYALVVTDLSFAKGKLQGLRLIEHLRSLPLPPAIVAVSDYEIASAIALSGGADAFVAKPFELSDLVATLREVLNNRKHVVPAAVGTETVPPFDELLAGGGIQVYVQPIYRIDCAPVAMAAVEFLTHGPVGSPFERPDILFAYAREAGKECVLDHHCIQLALMSAVKIPIQLRLAINVHASTLCSPPDFSEWLSKAAETARIDVSRITVEIVKHSPVWNQHRLLVMLKKLRKLGVQIALDDVGLGHSNYQMMIDARPDYFKLDRYFVHESSANPDRGAVVASIAKLAKDFGANVIAEGVETPDDLREVKSQGITLAQGYMFCSPKPLAEALASVLKQSTVRDA